MTEQSKPRAQKEPHPIQIGTRSALLPDWQGLSAVIRCIISRALQYQVRGASNLNSKIAASHTQVETHLPRLNVMNVLRKWLLQPW
jgi:hypothetical protein